MTLRQRGYMGEAKKPKGKKFKVGDKVVVTLEGLQAHSRSVPAHMGYTRETMSWRRSLSKFRDKKTVGTVTKVFPSSDQINVDFDGEKMGVPSYMVKLVKSS